MWAALIAAAAAAAAGGIAGAVGTWQQGKRAEEQLSNQGYLAWQQYLYGKDLGDQQYSLQRLEARTQLDKQEERLGEDLDRSLGQFNTGLLGQAYGIQNARIQTATSTGASLAAEGAGGTRGNGANALMRAYDQQALDRNIDLQNRENSQALTGMAARAANAYRDIEDERASWDAGGYRDEQKTAQDYYNRKMAELGAEDIEWRKEAARPGFLDYAAGILGGGNSGWNAGSSIGGAIESYGSRNVSAGTQGYNPATGANAGLAYQTQAQSFDGVGYGAQGSNYRWPDWAVN
jgi:hypothetical protein